MTETTLRQRQHPLYSTHQNPARGGSTKIRRFDGLFRKATSWHGLGKDSQLWSEEADCLVHLYAPGTPQRKPSFKVPFEAIEKLGSEYLNTQCLHTREPSNLNPRSIRRTDSGYASLSTISELDHMNYDLYIPAPTNYNPDQAHSYHVTTRNFVAYAVGKPIVGEELSRALIDLWQRLREWTPNSTPRAEFVEYLKKQGYTGCTGNPEYALACLKLAEEARIRDVWVNAFTHCVGMYKQLSSSPDFASLSDSTAGRIAQASRDMDHHTSRTTRAVGEFLEEQLGTERLGLSKPARDHLDRFRSFLHAFYVDRFGWFPPKASLSRDKRPWKKMYSDFGKLYEYLMDTESTADWASSRGVTGGVCVIQNVQAFDQRHDYEPLPHPLPLLPQTPSRPSRRHSVTSQKGKRGLKLGLGNNSTPDTKITTNQALAVATNGSPRGPAPCLLIQEYQRFEWQKLEVKLDVAEARKVRWLLVYGMLQMLKSIMGGGAAEAVGDRAAAAGYPLYVPTRIIGCPPFAEADEEMEKAGASAGAGSATLDPEGGVVGGTSLVRDAFNRLEGKTTDDDDRSPSRISIRPDCEADCADDFFASASNDFYAPTSPISRRDSRASLTTMAPSLRISTQFPQLPRTGSIRSSVQALHKSVVGSLSRRSTSRRNSLRTGPARVDSPCETVVEDKFDAAQAKPVEIDSAPRVDVDRSDQVDLQKEVDDAASRPQTAFHSARASPLGERPVTPVQPPNLSIATTNKPTPLNPQQHDNPEQIEDLDRSPCESNFTTTSGELLNSARSSYQRGNETPDTEFSCDDEASCKADSIHDESYSSISRTSSTNAGCYQPTGMRSSLRNHRRRFTSDTMKSSTSSEYPDENVQAADIDEFDSRGRLQARGLDKSVRYGAYVGVVSVYS